MVRDRFALKETRETLNNLMEGKRSEGPYSK